jgi:tetratricopeptide (TPR) repeat protein
MLRALARAEQVGNVRAMALCHHGIGATRYLTGHWRPAEAALRRGIELASSVGSTFGVLLGEHRLAILETASGRLEPAERRLCAALEAALGSDNVMVLEHSPTRLLAALAQNRLAAGDTDGAAAALDRGLEASAAVAAGFGECVTCDVLLYPVAVAVRLARGELDEAERACQRVEDSTTWFHSRAWIASAYEVRGLLACASGDRDVAADRLGRARAAFADLGQPYDEARCSAALATVLPGAAGITSARDADRTYRQLGVRQD